MKQTMHAELRWEGAAAFSARSGSGHTLRLDGPAEHGGKNTGPRPMEALLLGLGGCAAFDIVHILQRARQDVQGCELRLSAERAEEVPAVFTSILMHFRVRGRDLSEAQVERAVRMSAQKYCSASIMLQRAGVEIRHDWEIVP